MRKQRRALGLEHEEAKVDGLGGEELVAVVGAYLQTNEVGLVLAAGELERLDGGVDGHLAERALDHAELDVESRLRAAQLRLEYELIADEAMQRQVRVLLVVVDARLQHPLVEERAEAVRLEVELRRDVVRLVLLELQI